MVDEQQKKRNVDSYQSLRPSDLTFDFTRKWNYGWSPKEKVPKSKRLYPELCGTCRHRGTPQKPDCLIPLLYWQKKLSDEVNRCPDYDAERDTVVCSVCRDLTLARYLRCIRCGNWRVTVNPNIIKLQEPLNL